MALIALVASQQLQIGTNEVFCANRSLFKIKIKSELISRETFK